MLVCFGAAGNHLHAWTDIQNAEIQIIDEGISRRHARVVLSGESILIEDCGSTNGTFLNGQKLGSREVLKDGEVHKLTGRASRKRTAYYSKSELAAIGLERR